MFKTFSSQVTTGYQQQKKPPEDISLVISKWANTGLLDGLLRVHKDNMALLLENQAAELLKETPKNHLGHMATPLILRVFSGVRSNGVVSGQINSLPTSLLYYLEEQE